MFCIKCGCRIPKNTQKCPDCGADRPGMEYCGGFWSELNQNTQCSREESSETRVNAETNSSGANNEKNNANTFLGILAARISKYLSELD